MKLAITLGLATCLAAGTVHAADAFVVSVQVGSAAPVQRSYSTAEQAIFALSGDGVRALVPSYDGIQPASFVIDYRGLQMAASYVDFTVTELVLDIPAIGLPTQRFDGGTREASRQLMQDYLRSGDALARILKYLAAHSPVDPLAGNPSSLQTRMVRNRFLRDFDDLVRSASAAPATEAPASNGLTVRPELARHEANGLSSLRLDLPFSVAFDSSGPARPLSLDGELQFTDTGGARSLGLQLGLSWRQPVGEGWYLVPGASLGLSASPDLGGAGSMAALSATSAYRLVDRPDFALWMGNGITFTKSLGLGSGQYIANPGLTNQVYTNGLVLSLLPGSLLRTQWVELSITDSRYRGSELFDRRYDELGVAWVQRDGATTWRVELNYLDATNSRGWGARLHASF